METPDLHTFVFPLQQMLIQNFSISTQTIEELITTNNKVDLVVDVVNNVSSFESAVVVLVTLGGYGGKSRTGLYNICSRARTKLVIVNINSNSYNNTYTHTDLVEWETLI